MRILFSQSGIGTTRLQDGGAGKLPDQGDILEEILVLLTPKDFAGERIVITAGPTREPFDPVRFISNYSSGKMGYALATIARRRGADVTLISGPTALPTPAGVTCIHVTTALEMRDAVFAHIGEAKIIIKAAAVADYRPSVKSESKIKKGEGSLRIDLERNPDIIAEIGRHKEDRILIGFAMETENLIENADENFLIKTWI